MADYDRSAPRPSTRRHADGLTQRLTFRFPPGMVVALDDELERRDDVEDRAELVRDIIQKHQDHQEHLAKRRRQHAARQARTS